MSETWAYDSTGNSIILYGGDDETWIYHDGEWGATMPATALEWAQIVFGWLIAVAAALENWLRGDA